MAMGLPIILSFRSDLQIHDLRLTIADDEGLSLCALSNGEFDSRAFGSLHLYAEVGAEGADVAQLHAGPCLGQVGREGEGVESGGAYAEEALGDDAAVEGALGGEVALATLGPRLDGVRHMGAEQSGLAVAVEEVEGAFGVADIEGTAQCIKGGAVPEGLVAGLCEHAVLGPEAR